MAALAVPPVAMRSSTISTRISLDGVGFDFHFFACRIRGHSFRDMVSGGNLPALRTAMNPFPSMGGQRWTEQEPTSFKAGDHVEIIDVYWQCRFKGPHQNTERARISQHRHEITEYDALLGKAR